MASSFDPFDQGFVEPDSCSILKINAKGCRESMEISVTQGKLDAKKLDTIINSITKQGKLVLAINKYQENSYVFTIIKKKIIDATIKVFSQNNCKLDKIELVNDKMEVAMITPYGFMVQSEFNVVHYDDGTYQVYYPPLVIPPNGFE